MALGTKPARGRSPGRRMALAASALALLAVAGAGGAGRAAPPPQAHASVPGDIIVGFKAGVTEAEQEAVLARVGAAHARSWGFINAALAHVPDARRDTLIKQLENDPRVRYASRTTSSTRTRRFPTTRRSGSSTG